MKKAKQAKKTARKVVRKRPVARKCRPRREIPPQRKADPFWLDPRLIPAGWGYAWKPNYRPGGELPPGWGLVPYSRHAHDFPRSYQHGNFIVYGGLILMEALADQIASEKFALEQQARAQIDGFNDLIGRPEGYGCWIMPLSYIESEEIPRSAAQNEGPPVEVTIELKVRVPVRWRSAAEYLKLTFVEYVRRRIVMERMVLGCMDPFGEAVYEPVNLSFSPLHPAPKET